MSAFDRFLILLALLAFWAVGIYALLGFLV